MEQEPKYCHKSPRCHSSTIRTPCPFHVAPLGVQEFLLSEDLCEVASCVKELEVPHFHHEFVKRGMVLAMDRTEDACELMSTLFTFLFAEGVVAGQQFDIGFQRVKEVGSRTVPSLRVGVPLSLRCVYGFAASRHSKTNNNIA